MYSLLPVLDETTDTPVSLSSASSVGRSRYLRLITTHARAVQRGGARAARQVSCASGRAENA
eukprot:6189698-Pleurochrysis_carterae.AAC.2